MSELPAAICHICGKKFQKDIHCKRHIQLIHITDSNGEPLQKMNEVTAAICHICGKEFKLERYCERHIKKIHKINSKGELIPETTPVSYACATCGRRFSQKSTLRRHIDVVHEMIKKNGTELKCEQCHYTTFHKSNLKRHWLRNHCMEKPTKNINYNQCSMCHRKFRELKNLKFHEKKKHNLGVITQTARKCPLCEFSSLGRNKEGILKHFIEDHNISLTFETHNFNSLEEFHLWKKNLEGENGVYYSKNHECNQQEHYVCHRSGKYVGKGANIRRLKSIGSCKINGFCPSEMKLKNENGCFTLSYMPVHVGHELDPKYVRPSLGGLGGGRIYRKAMRGVSRRKQTGKEKSQHNESAVIVTVVNESDIVASEVVIEGEVPELENTAVNNVTTNPQNYNEDHDTMVYLEKVKLFQEFRDFEGFLQKNVTTIEHIHHVRREISKIMLDISTSNSSQNMGHRGN